MLVSHDGRPIGAPSTSGARHWLRAAAGSPGAALSAEITKLDVGSQIRGWVRTDYFFKAHTAAHADTSPVCRYYIPPALGHSHFFGRGTAECDATGQNNPSFGLESPHLPPGEWTWKPPAVVTTK